MRAAAALALLGGIGIFVFYLSWMGKGPLPGPAERHLRRMKDRTAMPDTFTPMTFADFRAMPSGRPLAEVKDLENRGVSLEGYPHSMSRSSDGDLYIHMAPERTERMQTLATVTTEVTPQWQRGSASWRMEPLQAALRPHDWLREPWPGGPRRTRVSGWLLYDFQYDPTLPSRRPRLSTLGSTRISAWEIHPVTRIEVWDDSLGRFAEVPR